MSLLLSPPKDEFIIKSQSGQVHYYMPKWMSLLLGSQVDEFIVKSIDGRVRRSRRVHSNHSPSPLRDKYILKDGWTYAYLKIKINT